ncbi:hypothetical protein C0Q70_21584 [Pomacea canaliculata]|uniref:Uncharacterized protein n=1 Tax=Pomacea canaliculata TaxID=400727 RepID=A0A2T7NCZ2_POMCA|nr:hypothetical protein C0Q70_21584 [Pomacea canaliculata]
MTLTRCTRKTRPKDNLSQQRGQTPLSRDPSQQFNQQSRPDGFKYDHTLFLFRVCEQKRSYTTNSAAASG